MLDNIQTIENSYKAIDVARLPAHLQAPVRSYVHGIGANMELDFHCGQYLMPVHFDDAGDDDTPDEVVEQLANGTIGFDQYPYEGIFWDMLGVEPHAYAGYLRATRYLRTVLPSDVIENESLYLLV